MFNSLNKLTSIFNSQNNTKQKEEKTTVDNTSTIIQLSIWQITIPLCLVLVFGIGNWTWTASSMVEGRYLFYLDISRERIKVRTDVDKRDNGSSDENVGEETKETTQL